MGGRPYTNTKLHYSLIRSSNRAAERKYKRQLAERQAQQMLSRMPTMVKPKDDKHKKSKD
jgi:hypothetical protein